MASERIGDNRGEMKACTPQELQAALQSQTIFGGRIGTNLLELGVIDEAQLAAALTKAYGVPCLAGHIQPEMDAIEAITPDMAEKFGCVPLRVDGRRLRVVVADPRDLAQTLTTRLKPLDRHFSVSWSPPRKTAETHTCQL